MKRIIFIQIVVVLFFSIEIAAQTKGSDSIGFQGAHIIDSLNKMKKFNLEVGITNLNVVAVGGNIKFDYLINKRKNHSIGIAATYSDNKRTVLPNQIKGDGYISKSLSGYFVNVSCYYGGRYVDKKHSKVAVKSFMGLGFTSWEKKEKIFDINNKWSFNHTATTNNLNFFLVGGLEHKVGPGWIYMEMSYFLNLLTNEAKIKMHQLEGKEPVNMNDYIPNTDVLELIPITWNIGYRWTF